LNTVGAPKFNVPLRRPLTFPMSAIARNSSMTCSLRLKGLIAVAGSLLLPASLTAESRLGEDGQRATAHLLFKIVIPQVLSVEIGESLAVGGNNHSLALLATGGPEGHHIILSTSGHRSVAQFAACSRAGAADGAMNCTVSMP
jgi:hypothetical protein